MSTFPDTLYPPMDAPALSQWGPPAAGRFVVTGAPSVGPSHGAGGDAGVPSTGWAAATGASVRAAPQTATVAPALDEDSTSPSSWAVSDVSTVASAAKTSRGSATSTSASGTHQPGLNPAAAPFQLGGKLAGSPAASPVASSGSAGMNTLGGSVHAPSTTMAGGGVGLSSSSLPQANFLADPSNPNATMEAMLLSLQALGYFPGQSPSQLAVGGAANPSIMYAAAAAAAAASAAAAAAAAAPPSPAMAAGGYLQGAYPLPPMGANGHGNMCIGANASSGGGNGGSGGVAGAAPYTYFPAPVALPYAVDPRTVTAMEMEDLQRVQMTRYRAKMLPQPLTLHVHRTIWRCNHHRENSRENSSRGSSSSSSGGGGGRGSASGSTTGASRDGGEAHSSSAPAEEKTKKEGKAADAASRHSATDVAAVRPADSTQNDHNHETSDSSERDGARPAAAAATTLSPPAVAAAGQEREKVDAEDAVEKQQRLSAFRLTLERWCRHMEVLVGKPDVRAKIPLPGRACPRVADFDCKRLDGSGGSSKSRRRPTTMAHMVEDEERVLQAWSDACTQWWKDTAAVSSPSDASTDAPAANRLLVSPTSNGATSVPSLGATSPPSSASRRGGGGGGRSNRRGGAPIDASGETAAAVAGDAPFTVTASDDLSARPPRFGTRTGGAAGAPFTVSDDFFFAVGDTRGASAPSFPYGAPAPYSYSTAMPSMFALGATSPVSGESASISVSDAAVYVDDDALAEAYQRQLLKAIEEEEE